VDVRCTARLDDEADIPRQPLARLLAGHPDDFELSNRLLALKTGV